MPNTTNDKTAPAMAPRGIRERIMAAKTDDEIKTLLDEGGTFTDASDKVRRRWHAAAAARRQQLNTK